MNASIAVVADDLTGAADTGVGFLRAGLATTVAWVEQEDATTRAAARPTRRGPDIEVLSLETEVLSIDTRGRARDAAGAHAVTCAVVESVRTAGVPALYVKVDSTLRGHVGEIVKAALTSWHPGAIAVVALAFPGTGRTNVGGLVHVDGVPLDLAGVPSMLDRAGLRTAHADLARVRGGTLATDLRARHAAGVHALVCDAETDDDLRAIARAGAALGARVVWVGAGGLASAVSATLGSAADTRAGGDAGSASPARTPGPVLVAVGSTSTVAREQAAHLVAAGAAHCAVPLAALDADHGPVATAFRHEVERHLRHDRDVVLTLGVAGDAVGTDDDRLTTRLGVLLQPCAPLVGGLVATGGDTATGILRAWGTTALRLLGEVEPGVPLALGVSSTPVPVVTKAGAFGGPGTLTAARDRLRQPLAPPHATSTDAVPTEGAR